MQTFFLSIILLQVEPVRTVYSLKLLKSLGSILSADPNRYMYLLSQKYSRRKTIQSIRGQTILVEGLVKILLKTWLLKFKT